VKLKSFTASKVYGYLAFTIDFHSDLSFLVGVNGSGKTTILRLIQALLTPSLRDLISIPFKRASVTFENQGESFTISSKKSIEKLSLSVTTIDKFLSLPNIGQEELDYMLSREGRNSDFFQEFQLKHSDHEVFKFISQINAPVFLGLERIHKNLSERTGENFFERERMLSSNAKRGLRFRRVIEGSLAAGLMETQALVQDTYKRLRRMEDHHSQRLRETILLSAFKYDYLSFPEGDFESLLPNWTEKQQILQRKEEIELALSKIGLSGDKITTVLNEFFQRLEGLFKSMNDVKKSKGIPVEWILNRAQIDRVSELIQIIDAHKSRVDKLFSPINTFIDCVNSFYADTRKCLTIDTVGQLSILRPDKEPAPIEALSSGERQLVIIFAHLLFNNYGTRSSVFVIDEPELSLHLKWQEIFVEKALEVNPNIQLILATHSPEIIGDYDNKCITV